MYKQIVVCGICKKPVKEVYMKIWDYVIAANTVGWFLGDYEKSDQMIQDYALEDNILGLGYFRPDGAYITWRLQGTEDNRSLEKKDDE